MTCLIHSYCANFVSLTIFNLEHQILQSEKESLSKEVSRWSTRCNELIEQCNKVDAKEFARLQAENSKLWGQLRKRQEDYTAEITASQENMKKLEEENGRVAEEKRQLLSTINTLVFT